jgi:DNA-binding transcriptional regulator YdaS (Cro superfamily)
METPPAAMTRLRADAYAAWVASERLGGEPAQAERLGVAQATLNRARNGVGAPGSRFIAQVLAATGLKFEDLFEVVTEAAR